MSNPYSGGPSPDFNNPQDPSQFPHADYDRPRYEQPGYRERENAQPRYSQYSQPQNPPTNYATPGYAQPGYPQPHIPQPQYHNAGYGNQHNLYETGGVVPYSGAAAGYGVPAQVPPGYTQKNWIVAALLAFFLGSFGVHNFYLGYKSKAMTQLVITLLSYATIIILIGFLGLVVTGLWAFVEFIMILVGAGSYEHDAYGYPLER
ncbi:NINE protein [Corynebacterium resistens]